MSYIYIYIYIHIYVYPCTSGKYAFQSMAWRSLGLAVLTLQLTHRADDVILNEALTALRIGDTKHPRVHQLLAQTERLLPVLDGIIATTLYARRTDVALENKRQLESKACCSVLQCVAVSCSVLQRVEVSCSVLQCLAGQQVWPIKTHTDSKAGTISECPKITQYQTIDDAGDTFFTFSLSLSLSLPISHSRIFPLSLYLFLPLSLTRSRRPTPNIPCNRHSEIYVCIYIHADVHVYTYIHMCMYMYSYICMYISLYIRI